MISTLSKVTCDTSSEDQQKKQDEKTPRGPKAHETLNAALNPRASQGHVREARARVECVKRAVLDLRGGESSVRDA